MRSTCSSTGARAQNPTFVLDDANRATIGGIGALVDGLPLAIELAAARSRMLAPSQLLERWHSRFQLLGGARGAGARQATLRRRSTGRGSCSRRGSRRPSRSARCSKGRLRSRPPRR